MPEKQLPEKDAKYAYKLLNRFLPKSGIVIRLKLNYLHLCNYKNQPYIGALDYHSMYALPYKTNKKFNNFTFDKNGNKVYSEYKTSSPCQSFESILDHAEQQIKENNVIKIDINKLYDLFKQNEKYITKGSEVAFMFSMLNEFLRLEIAFRKYKYVKGAYKHDKTVIYSFLISGYELSTSFKSLWEENFEYLIIFEPKRLFEYLKFNKQNNKSAKTLNMYIDSWEEKMVVFQTDTLKGYFVQMPMENIENLNNEKIFKEIKVQAEKHREKAKESSMPRKKKTNDEQSKDMLIRELIIPKIEKLKNKLKKHYPDWNIWNAFQMILYDFRDYKIFTTKKMTPYNHVYSLLTTEYLPETKYESKLKKENNNFLMLMDNALKTALTGIEKLEDKGVNVPKKKSTKKKSTKKHGGIYKSPGLKNIANMDEKFGLVAKIDGLINYFLVNKNANNKILQYSSDGTWRRTIRVRKMLYNVNQLRATLEKMEVDDFEYLGSAKKS